MWGFTKIQQRAMVFLLANFAAGAGVLYYRRQQQPPPPSPGLVAQLQSIAGQSAQDTVQADDMQSPNVAITPPHKESTRQQVNLNTATAAELTALPGIGVTMAQRIVAFREQHGKFQRLEDLAKVRGIGRRKIEVLRDRVIVP